MLGALVGFCGLTAEGKSKTIFPTGVDGRTAWADWGSAQWAICALSETGLACLIDPA
jgi:hypothetical protein